MIKKICILLRQIIKILIYLLPYYLGNSISIRNKRRRLASIQVPEPYQPELFNSQGEPLHVFYLQDEMYRDQPYSFVTGRQPRYILWDRYNFGLRNQFYSHKYIFDHSIYQHHVDSKRFGLLFESESIVPGHFEKVLGNRNICKDYTAIFTHSWRILNELPNSLFLPGAGVWYGTKRHGGNIEPTKCKTKSRNISIVSSSKALCELHEYRLSIAKKYLESTTVDVYGPIKNGQHVKIADTLDDYRYSIAIENHISPYWFTEKIMNCFASMTIPIYYGATRIADFFNPDGIMFINGTDIDKLDLLLAECNRDEYERRLPAIIDNYARVQDFLSIEDYLYTNYKEMFLR